MDKQFTIFNPYNGETTKIYGSVMKETKRDITVEVNYKGSHGIITFPKAFMI